MRTIAVYFKGTDDAGPPSGKPEYVEAYTVFARTVERKGGRLIVVRGADTFDGTAFTKRWELEGDVWNEKQGGMPADVYFVKDRDFPKGVPGRRVNGLAFEDLCSEKDRTIELFPDAFPKTVIAGTEAELDAALAQIDGGVIVAKPVDGACGRGVYVGAREAMDRTALVYPLLLQEWIDMSQGIAGQCTGPHDLRIVLVGDQVALCTLRTPPDGSLIANAAQGGSIKLLAASDIPAGALALAMDIDRRLQQYPERVYSVDMGLHRGTTWKVIELNAPPGLTPPKWGPLVTHYYDVLADHLLKMAA